MNKNCKNMKIWKKSRVKTLKVDRNSSLDVKNL